MADSIQLRPPVPDDDLDSAKKELLLSLEKRLAKNGRESFAGKDEGLGVITGEFFKLVEAARSDNFGLIYQQASELAGNCLWLMATIEAMHTRELARKTQAGRKKAEDPEPKA